MVLMALCLYLFTFHLTITRSCSIQELAFQKDWCFLGKRVNFLNPKDVAAALRTLCLVSIYILYIIYIRHYILKLTKVIIKVIYIYMICLYMCMQ